MRNGSRGNWISALAGTSCRSLTIAGVIALAGCTQPAPPPAPAAVAPKPAPRPAADPVEPLSESCRGAVARAEKDGLIRPGTIDRDGAVILTDARWSTRLDAELQEGLALCVSHYIAGGQNRWLKKVQFRNQTTGVIYATVEGTRFRIGE